MEARHETAGMHSFKASASRTWTLARKNVRLYVKQGPVLIFGLFFPFFMTLAWMIGRPMPATQLFVGIVSMTAFFTATAISPVVLPIETREKSLEKLLSMPIRLRELLAAIVIASTLYACILTGVVFTAMSPVLPGVNLLALLASIAGILLLAIAGSLLGLLVSAHPTDMTSNVMVLINLVKFPMIFAGGIFISLPGLPLAGVVASLFSPVTFLSDLLHLLAHGESFFGIAIDLLGLLAWIVMLSLACMMAHRKTMIKRFSEGGGKMMMQGKP